MICFECNKPLESIHGTAYKKCCTGKGYWYHRPPCAGGYKVPQKDGLYLYLRLEKV